MSRFNQFPLGVRLLLILFILLLNYVLFPSVAILLILPFTGMDNIKNAMEGNFMQESYKYAVLFIQAIASLGAFAFTSILIGQMETGQPFKRLKLNVKAPVKFFALAILAILMAQVFIQFIVELNQKIPVPEMLKPLVEAGKQEEKIVNALMAGKSAVHFISVSMVLAVIPAMAEEFFFRGLLLGELLREKIHPAVAITITGFIFSVAHIQFENFIAIWILGAFLGYLFYVTGSLWVPIAAHFTNNFLAVLLKYLYNAGTISNDVTEAAMPAYAVVISIVIFSFCLFVFNRWKVEPDFDDIPVNEPTEL